MTSDTASLDNNPEVKNHTIAEDLVVTKYKMAAEITNRVLKEVVARCVEGASVRDTCIYGDKVLTEETSRVFKKEKELKKGIAFPTCISVNNCVCHFSPLNTEPDITLKDLDVCKIDLGCHVDGYIAVVAHTHVVGLEKGRKLTGRKADVILAAHYASEAALRLVKPGNESNQITEGVSKIAESFKCKPIEGMLSHQLEQDIIDGPKSIIQNPNEAQRKEHEKCTFETNEVYAVDVLISTGDAIGKETDTRTSIFKKTDENYMLKLKSSKMFISEVNKNFGHMAFNLREFEDEKRAKLGVVECVQHKLIDPYQVLYDKNGEFVAQYKFTVLLMPSGSHKITGLPFDTESYQSEYSIQDEDLKKLLATSVNQKKKKKKQQQQQQAKQQAAQKTDEGAGNAS